MRMGNCGRRCAAGVQRESPRTKLAGFQTNNAGSDLLSHTPPPSVRGGQEESPCAWETVVADALPAYKEKAREQSSRAFRRIMPAATYSPTHHRRACEAARKRAHAHGKLWSPMRCRRTKRKPANKARGLSDE